jgi:hypothetical protein
MTYETYAEIMQRVNGLISSIEDCDEQSDDRHDECAEALKRAQEIHDALASSIPAYYAAWQEEVSNAEDCAEMGPIDPHGIFNYKKLADLEKQFGIDNSNLYNGPELVDEATQKQVHELVDKLDAVWKHYNENLYTMSPEDKVDEGKICEHEEEELCKQYPEEIVSVALLIKHGGSISESAPPFGATVQQ